MEEDDWGNIQECTPDDCEDWEEAIGWGNDDDGHVKILKVKDLDEGTTWVGNEEVNEWYDEWITPLVDMFS